MAAEVRARGALLALLVLLPVVAAHVAHDRPSIQARQEPRTVQATLASGNATLKLLRGSDPVSDVITHTVDPRRGVVGVEYRSDLPDPASAFFARFELARVIEYADTNGNGAYDPVVDAVTRSWRLAGYTWDAKGPDRVRVGGVDAQSVVWLGNASSGPRLRIDAVAAGTAFLDEGAEVSPQDALLYFDVTSLPVRGVGHLHAIEGVVHASPGATARLDSGTNGTTGILVEAEGRLAFLDWGGEAMIDGQEQPLVASLDAPAADGSRTFRIHLPLMDEGARLVLVEGVEYVTPTKRTVLPWWGVLASLGVVALVSGRRGWRFREASR